MHPSRILLLPTWLLLTWLQSSKALIPASMLLKVARMNSTKEFLLHMVVNNNRSRNVPKGSMEDILFTQEGDVDPNGVVSAASRVSSPEGCNPTERPVNLPSDPEPVVVYYPTCVRLRRCGGCCVSEILECAPSQAATQTVTVIRARYPHVNADSLEYDGQEDIEMEVHLACECRCRVQPYHCNDLIQDYAPDECRCKCKNEHQATGCPVTKKWDEKKCKCVCSKPPDCLHGEVFRTETCRCENRTPAPPVSKVYDPCARKHCPPQYKPRKVSAYACRCEYVTSLPRRSRSLVVGPKKRIHVADRFPMMRAGVFDQH